MTGLLKFKCSVYLCPEGGGMRCPVLLRLQSVLCHPALPGWLWEDWWFWKRGVWCVFSLSGWWKSSTKGPVESWPESLDGIASVKSDSSHLTRETLQSRVAIGGCSHSALTFSRWWKAVAVAVAKPSFKLFWSLHHFCVCFHLLLDHPNSQIVCELSVISANWGLGS